MKNRFTRIIPYILIPVFILAACAKPPLATVSVSTLEIDHATVTGELAASKVQFLRWQTSGVVEDILPVGSQVKQGDQIASLDPDTLDQNMTRAIGELAEISALIEERDGHHEIYLETANAAVRYFRKKVEAAENTYKYLDVPKLSEEEYEALKKNLSDAETEMNERYVRYQELRDHGEGAKKIQDAYLEWRAAEADYQEHQDWMDKYMAAPTDAEIVIARQKLEDARTQLNNVIDIRDDIKNGDHRVLFQHNEGYNSYSTYSNYVFYSNDKWNPVHNTLDDEYEAKKLTVDTMYQLAPFDGEIIFVDSAVGRAVEQEDRSVGLLDRETLMVRVNVPENLIQRIKVNDIVSLVYGSNDMELEGVIRSIDPISEATINEIELSMDESSANITLDSPKTFEVIIDPKHKDIPIFLGAPVQTRFQLSQRLSVLAVPDRTIQRDAMGEFVMVANLFGDQYKARVERGETVGDLVIVYPFDDQMLTSEDLIVDPAAVAE